MTVAGAVRAKVQRLPRGKLFTAERFSGLGTPAAVSKALSRLTLEGVVDRPFCGIFVRPEYSRFAGKVPPSALKVVHLIVKRNGETIQTHGAAAALHFKISTQMPLYYVFHTNGPSRTIRISRKIPVKFVHTTNRRLLQFSGTKIGAAISALWYVGNEFTTPETIAKIKEELDNAEFNKLKSADLPAWMKQKLNLTASGFCSGLMW